MKPEYRAWLKEEKILLPVTSLYFPLNSPSGKDLTISIDDDYEWRALEDVILEQFTGLKDKNGKKIFEGDVVETRAGEHEQGVWQYGGVVTITDIRWLPEDLNYAVEIEIIGNIHEMEVSE